jgi:hypothetical protein
MCLVPFRAPHGQLNLSVRDIARAIHMFIETGGKEHYHAQEEAPWGELAMDETAILSPSRSQRPLEVLTSSCQRSRRAS